MPTATPPTTTKRPSLADIPLAPGVDLGTVKGSGDKEVLVELRPGPGLTEADAKTLVDAIAARTLNSFRGHVAPADRGHTFKDPVASWIGAVIIDGTAYVRGVVHDAEVQRWLNSGRLDLDAVVESNYLALDFMSLDRGSHAGQVVQPGSATTDTSASGGTTTGTTGNNGSTSGGDGSAGEMQRPMGRWNGQDVPPLPVRRRSLTPAGEAIGSSTGTTAQQAPAAPEGLKRRRVAI
jgi:hypothetical protein